MAKYGLPIVIFIVILFSVSQSALAAIGSSSSYILEIADINNSVTTGSSASYGLDGTTGIMGDTFDGQSSSENYNVCSGYIEESTGVCIITTPAPPPPPPPSGGTTGPIAGGRPDEETPPALDFELQPTEPEDLLEEEPVQDQTEPPSDLHGAAEEPQIVPPTTTAPLISELKPLIPATELGTTEPAKPALIEEPTLQPAEEYPCTLEISNEYWYIQKNCWHKNIIEKDRKPLPEKITQPEPQKCLSYWLLVPYIPLLLLIIFLLWREISQNKNSHNKKKVKRRKR